MSESPLVQVSELKPPYLLFDTRPAPAYAAGHLPGALHADLDRDLAGPADIPARGGRHPLPDPAAWAARLASWGIRPETRVVIYDDQGGANAAARMWWMLRSVGHEHAFVLDGGLQAAIAAGWQTTIEAADASPAAVGPARPFSWPQATIDEVDERRDIAGHLVLDVRAAPRYRGEVEPLDPVAGHIPGARNLPLTENLGPDGRFLSPEALRRQYQALLGDVPPERLVVHCGSGVTACHTLLALEIAGLHGAALYVGSWSEWCRSGRLQATGATP
ncbi:sulfurtransferase [Vulgatibacter incomptus]|uniref:Thiosulfate sulfurtransferase, rhodanese n=1 Tax=Vulgatibacter incomptus TaxID=1391653 RepID=A0A0K1PEB2_9BACT|nr:sulfurtransferase [Vulgatibacter incomptus]AKU91469.1 Thiosulfate sulfurtransferase, rhodanese [Vulgatibacter incomptus]